MKKMAAVTGLLLLSSSLFVGCGTTAAPNTGDGRYDGARTEATGGVQPLMGNLQYNRFLQTKIQTIPGAQHTTVYVSGDTAFVVFNEVGTSSAGRVASLGKNANVPLHGDYGVGTARTEPGMTTETTGPTGKGNQMIRPGTYGTTGVGLDAGRPGYMGTHHPSDYGMIGTGTAGIGTIAKGTNESGRYGAPGAANFGMDQNAINRTFGLTPTTPPGKIASKGGTYGAGGTTAVNPAPYGTGQPSTLGLTGQRGPTGITGEAGTAYGITSLNLQKKIADTIQAADKSIQHVYLVTRIR